VIFAPQVFASNRLNRLCATARQARHGRRRLHAAAKTSQISRALGVQRTTTRLSPFPNVSQCDERKRET
jgi:hypothetical protein